MKRTTATSEMTAGSKPSPTKQSRHKLWQLADSCHCMIIGTCLTLPEVKAICRKCDYPIDGLSDYQLHRFVVGQAGHAESSIARRTQKLLDAKYSTDIARLRGRQTETTLLDQWQVLRDAGRVAGTLWALVTHPDCNNSIIETVYGEVHMLSHLTGASTHKQAQALTPARREIESLQKKLRSQQLSMTEKVNVGLKKIAHLEKLNAELRHQQNNASASTSRLSAIDNRDREIVKSTLRQTNSALRTTRNMLTKAQATAEQTNQNYLHLKEDNEKLESLIAHLTEQTSTDEKQCDKSLSGKCLLLLGGMPSQCKHFKAYVEANNGDFLHHDGGVESNISRIDQLISRADAVLCPVEQVSHSAMLRAKKLCKSSDKPMVFLPKSSLTAFVSGLREIS